MSIDYTVYIRGEHPIDAAEFERYASSVGITLCVDPEFHPDEHFGFLPFRLAYDEKIYKSGFEYETEPYEEVEAEPDGVKISFLQKLFGRKKQPSAAEYDFSRAIKGSSQVIWMRCSSADSFEILLAYCFAAYLCRYCGGVLDDPQSGRYYTDAAEIEEELRRCMEELREEASRGDPSVHEFDGWE